MDDGGSKVDLPDSAAGDRSVLVRRAARALLIDSNDRILLFDVIDAFDGRRFWLTPGGGVRDGESFEQAARRELFEETGLDADPGACVWTRSHVFPARAGMTEAREQFYAVRCQPFEPDPANWEPAEAADLARHRWWSLPEITAATGAVFVPRRLAELLPAVLAGEMPAVPIDCGV
jgi:8-oxo-dGTP pyrophosphatase MutT (NUDIX family)